MAGERLDIEQKNVILDAFAAGYRPYEIVRMFQDMFDRSITIQSVIHYRDHYQKEIRKRRRNLNKKLEESIPIARKAYRLQRLQEILHEALTWRLKTITKDDVRIYEKKLGSALKALEQASVEMEGKKLDITSNGEKVQQNIFVLPGFAVHVGNTDEDNAKED